MHPYYIARAFGGLLFLIGTAVGCYNIWMTVRTAPAARIAPAGQVPDMPAAPVAAGE